MVSGAPAGSAFLAEAARLGRLLAELGIRHAGRCTWLGDRPPVPGAPRAAGALRADFATGTAGVGWLLARLGCAVDDATLTTVGTEALRHSLAGANDLVRDGRLGFHEGATGVAWAALDAGVALDCAELMDHAVRMGCRIAARADALHARPAGLWDGQAGMLAGLSGMLDHCDRCELRAAADSIGERLVRWVPLQARIAQGTGSGIGLAHGASGIGLALADWSGRFSVPRAFEAAAELFRTERVALRPGREWHGAGAHAWAGKAAVAPSLCAGAAGIGIARLGAYAVRPACNLLAEASAAIDVVRAAVGPRLADASLCHGTGAQIELLLAAWTTLAQRAHLDAARRLGRGMVETARMRGAYGSGLGPACRNPSLLLGLAGTALVLLRLHDPAAAPGAALPSAKGT